MFPRAPPRPQHAGWLVAAALPTPVFATEGLRERVVAASPRGRAEVVGEGAEAGQRAENSCSRNNLRSFQARLSTQNIQCVNLKRETGYLGRKGAQ